MLAHVAGVSERMACRGLARHRAGHGVSDHSSAPRCCPHRLRLRSSPRDREADARAPNRSRHRPLFGLLGLDFAAHSSGSVGTRGHHEPRFPPRTSNPGASGGAGPRMGRGRRERTTQWPNPREHDRHRHRSLQPLRHPSLCGLSPHLVPAASWASSLTALPARLVRRPMN